MYERMLDKALRPEPGQICAYMGADAYARLSALETALAARYDLTRELRFPFGNSYGWGYKYAHRSTHLCYAFFEKGAFTLMVQIGDRQVRPLERALAELSERRGNFGQTVIPAERRAAGSGTGCCVIRIWRM